MQRESLFHLTNKEVAILSVMLARSSGKIAFERLLRDKLNFAKVHFSDDVPADVVTLNSRVFYTVKIKPFGPHLVVQSAGDDLPAFALSIHTVRGLGLLGLAVGEMITIAYDNGVTKPSSLMSFSSNLRPIGVGEITSAALKTLPKIALAT